MKKALLIGLGIFATIAAAVVVFYLVRGPGIVPTATPTPLPTTVAEASPTVAPIMVVNPPACELSFAVTASAPPSISPSPSPSISPSPSPSGSVSPSPSPSSPVGAQLDCVTKRAYVDDSRNQAGFYYLNSEITDTTTIASGQAIVYNIVVRNTGGTAVSDTTITDVLSSNLTYMDGDSGCAYDSAARTVTCTIGSLAGGTEAQRSIRVKVTVAGTSSIANTARVSSTNGQSDSCSIQLSAEGKVASPSPAAPSALPTAGVFEITAGTMGVGLILLLAGALGLLLI